MPEVEVVAPRNQLGGFRGGNNVVRGTQDAAASPSWATSRRSSRIQSMQLLAGRFLNRIDLAERRKVAVIGTRVVELLFEKGEDPIGEAIQINGVYFKVVGIFGSRQSGGEAERDAQTIFVPFSTFQQAFNCGNQVDWFAVTSKPTACRPRWSRRRC